MEVRIYTAFGDRGGNTVSLARTGYADAVTESDLPWYLLGLRFYLPWLRRFISPDAASPFDAGGFNRYAYCSGDPINRIDTSGNASFGWLGKLLGNVLGAIGNAASAVAQATPTTALMAISRTAEVVSVATSIGAVAMAALDEAPAAGILGWIAGGSGLAGLGLGVAGQAVSKGMRAGRSGTTGSVSRELVGGVVTPMEFNGPPNDPSVFVMKTSFVDTDNRVVTNFSGVGLQGMSSLKHRIGLANADEAFTLVPGTISWFNENRGVVIGFDSRVRDNHIETLVRGLHGGMGGSGEKIRVFTGVHGNPSGHGDNWDGGRYRSGLRIADDSKKFRGTLMDEGLANIKFYDMGELTDSQFKRKLTKDGGTNVLGWCFSAADEKANEARVSRTGAQPFYFYRTYDHPTQI
ncbi:hypothetical protein KCV01_g19623, partial [Aureobasidium melanogenum]